MTYMHKQVVVRGGGKIFGRQGGEKIFSPIWGEETDFLIQKGGVKRTLLRGELKIVQQRGAKLPPGRTLNRGVQMKKNFVRGGQKKFSYGVLSSCACMLSPKAVLLVQQQTTSKCISKHLKYRVSDFHFCKSKSSYLKD